MSLWQIAALAAIMGTSSTRAAGLPGAVPVKDSEGTTFAVVVQCSECRSPKAGSKKACHTGVEKGWLDGRPCGQCLLDVNGISQMKYPYDLHFTGKLVNDQGEPVKNRFVKLSLPNGWTVKTRTTEHGTFRLLLGATDARKSSTPLITDLGECVDGGKDDTSQYALFLLPDGFAKCPPAVDGAAAEPKKGKP